MVHFFYSVYDFDYRGFCKNVGECLKKHLRETKTKQKQKLSGKFIF